MYSITVGFSPTLLGGNGDVPEGELQLHSGVQGHPPQIASEDIRNHLPARFDGQDKDLLDAEASIDPLVNNAPPTPSGIDIN